MRVLILLLGFCCAPLFGQLPSATQGAIDATAAKILAQTGVPSASIAVVRDGKIAYVRAYGDARLDPKTPARPEMHYKIASNSKQIAATAILLLVEQNQLSLDDPVARFLPQLTRAGEVTIRELLSHTSGYQDYYPLDYVAPFMVAATTPQQILDVWGKKPLDFEPGTEWQYSNTNFVVIGQIVEKITGKPLIDFLRTRIFEPLDMHTPIDVGRDPWSESDPAGYTTYALGPARPVRPEGNGWMYAAGELAMTASDLARWDISLMNGTVLKPASLQALTTEEELKGGTGTGYALGLDVSKTNGHRRWAHSGGAAGFNSYNATFPDDKILGHRSYQRRGRRGVADRARDRTSDAGAGHGPTGAPDPGARPPDLHRPAKRKARRRSGKRRPEDVLYSSGDRGFRGVARAAGRSVRLFPNGQRGARRHDVSQLPDPDFVQVFESFHVRHAGRKICAIPDLAGFESLVLAVTLKHAIETRADAHPDRRGSRG